MDNIAAEKILYFFGELRLCHRLKARQSPSFLYRYKDNNTGKQPLNTFYCLAAGALHFSYCQ